jgi:glucose/arabinose dehydrogenase
MVTGGLESVAISVPSQYSAVGLSPTANRINIPQGWTANVFAAGAALRKLRFLTFGPDSLLYGANMNGNNVLAFPDKDRDGVADAINVVATGFTDLNNVEFWNDTMYASHKAGIEKLTDADRDGFYETRVLLFDRQKLSGQNGGHTTRSLAIDTIRQRLYVTLGSLGNADREPNRAVIEEHLLDGTGRRFYATGVRNAVGLTIHPRTGRLWANNNGSDNHGNNIPGEWVDLVREG